MPKVVVAALVTFVACSHSFGFVATLGLGSSGLGTGSKMVASCGRGMTFAYRSAFDTTSSGYVVNGIDLSDIPAACRDKSLSATFYDSSGKTVGSAVDATLAASGPTQSIAITPSSNTIEARRVSGVSVVVSSRR